MTTNGNRHFDGKTAAAKWVLDRRLRLTTAMLLCYVGSDVAAQSWQFVAGNDGGAFLKIAVAPSNSDLAFATGGAGRTQIYKTSDGGETWTKLTDAISSNGIVKDIDIDPVSPDVILVTTADGLFLTSDGGTNWDTPFSAPFGFDEVLIYPGDSQIMYAASLYGVAKSEDGGHNWIEASTGLTGDFFGNLAIDPGNSDIVYVSTEAGAIFRTTDAGQSWSPVIGNGYTDSEVGQLALDPTNSSIVYGLGSGSSTNMFRSIDGGSNWTDISISGRYLNSFIVDPATPTNLYVCTDAGLSFSDDSGLNWTTISSVFVPSGPPTSTPEGGCGGLAVGSNLLTMYAAAGSGVRASVDGGFNWTDRNSGLYLAGIEEVVVDPQTPSTLYSVSDGGIYRSVDNAATWSRVLGFGRASLSQLAIDPQIPTTLFVEKGGNLFRSLDDGVSWDVQQPPGGGFVAIDPQTSSTVYLWGGTGRMLKSVDGGTTWMPANVGIENVWVTSMVINPHTPSHLYIGSYSDGFYRSIDGGATWAPINNGITDPGSGIFSRRLVVDPFDADTLYASANSALYRSTDDGDSWADTTYGSLAGINHLLAVPGPDTSTVLYADGPDGDSCYCNNAGVWRSLDGGATWAYTGAGIIGSAYSGSGAGNNLLASVPRAGADVYIGTDHGIFRLRSDLDNDGVLDSEDAFPLDATEALDTDADGIGNNADPDDDNDGIPDELDDYPLGRFTDTPPASYWAFTYVEALARSGITGGCSPSNYCPEGPVTRAQMAVFLERGIHGSTYAPPSPTGTLFLDVAQSDFAAGFIEQLYADGITGGCGGGNYCPSNPVTRAQMAVFLLRAKHGASYAPPPASGVFADVNASDQFRPWIEQLAAEGITGGCGGGNYCPNDPVTRAQMAVFLVRAFGL